MIGLVSTPQVSKAQAKALSYLSISLIFCLICLACLVLAGCSSGSSSSGESGSYSISGVASKGIINNGLVRANAVNNDGTIGVELGSDMTDISGQYSIATGDHDGPVILEVTGGSYTDEATGLLVNNINLRAVIPAVNGNRKVAITPLTEIAVQIAGSTLTLTQINNANAAVSVLIGGADVTETQPQDINGDLSSASQSEKDYTMVLAAVSQMIEDGSATDVATAITMISNDLNDDGFLAVDGTGAGDLLTDALGNFVASAENNTGLSVDDIALDENLLVASTDPNDITAPNAPVIMSPADGTTTNDNTPTTSGTAEAGSTVELFDSDGTTSLGTDFAIGGNWSITTSTLSDGAHSLTAKATDTSSNTSNASTAVSITVDTSGPSVTLKSPADGVTNISIDSTISATFDEAVNSATITASTFTVSDGVAGTIALSGGNTIATFTPSSDLSNNTTYTVTLTTGITDDSGNTFAGTFWSFTTVALPAVGAHYSAAPDWNDYVKASDTTTACDGSETGGYLACVHGGEMRAVEVPDNSSCNDLSATDALGVFDWSCDGSTNPVRMVSTGLKANKNLSDLLDFATPGWLNNSVTITGTGAGLPFTTASATWWDNSVVVDNDGGSLSAAGSVYVVTANPSASYTMDASKLALVVQPGVTLSGPVSSSNIIYTTTQNFLWLEGMIDATGDDKGVFWEGVKFSVLHNLAASNAGTNGVHLYTSSNNSLSNISAANNGNYGFYIQWSTNNNLTNIAASNNGLAGFNIYYLSTGNSLSNISADNNTFNGINIYSLSSNNTLSNVTVANNVSTGIALSNSSDNILSNITASNNSGGIRVNGSSNNTLMNITAANNESTGVTLIGSSDDNKLLNITVVNNGDNGVWLYNVADYNALSNITAVNSDVGIYLGAASNNSLLNIATADNLTGVLLTSTSNNYFTGLLKVGNNSVDDCSILFAANQGLIETTCTDDGLNGSNTYTGQTSDATLTRTVGPELTLATSFVAKVGTGGSGVDVTEDSTNPDDDNIIDNLGPGLADFANITDWMSFENSYRTWGWDNAFPDAGSQGRWTTGTGRIWDWSVDVDDTVIRAVLADPDDADPIPDGDDTITHTWSDTSTTTYLRNASEIIGTGGNDDGLCETDETCLFTPNIGSYQGHGALQSAGPFTGGAITGVTLMKYPSNGY